MTDARNSRFLHRTRLLLLSTVLTVAGAPAAFATAPESMSYWVSMRGITEDAQPSFVAASYVQTGEYTSVLAGCHGQHVYLRSSDAALVQSSRASGETVQIHTGEPGSTPQQSAVICLLQIDR